MARLWSSGFELNSLSIEWDTTSGAAASVVSTGQRSGGYCMKIASLASGTRSGVFKGAWSGTGGTSFVRFYVYIETLPSAEQTIAFLGTSITAPQIRVTVDNTGTLRVRESTLLGTYGSALSTGTWYCIEGTFTIDVNNTTSWRVDGGATFVTNATANNSNSTGLFVGGNGNAEAQTTGAWYFDDVAINDTSGAAQTGYPGPGSIIHLHPAGAGDFTEGQSGPSAGATAWQTIDEVPPNDATDYWILATDVSASPTAPDRLDVTCESFSPSADAITLVQVGARVKPATNASCSFVPRIKSQASGTLVEGTTTQITGTAWVTNDDTATSKLYKLTAYTDPQGSGAWTTALLNTMQIGVRAPDGSPDVWVSALWALVEYVPGTGSGTVTSDLALKWDSFAEVYSSLTLKSDIANTVTSDIVLKFDIFNLATSDLTLKWDMIGQIYSSLGLKLDIANIITSDFSIKFDVLNQITSDFSLKWDIFSAIYSGITLPFDIVGQVYSDLAFKYTILNILTSDNSFKFNVLNQISSDVAFKWNTQNEVSSNLTVLFDLASSISSVYSDLSCKFDMSSYVASDETVRWNILSTVNSDFASSFGVLNQVYSQLGIKFDVYQTVSSDVAIVFDTNKLTQTDIQFLYDMAGSVLSDITLKWNLGDIRGKVVFIGASFRRMIQ